MRILTLLICFVSTLFSSEDALKIFHKTIGKIESYKEHNRLHLKPSCVRRLSKNLLTPIHSRSQSAIFMKQNHLLKKTKDGPLTITFFLPLSMKKNILSLLANNQLFFSIPSSIEPAFVTNKVEIDKYGSPPKGLFSMKAIIDNPNLSPSDAVFIHLLKGDN